MSHGITEFDNLFVSFTPAWHGLGTVVDEALSSEDALRIAKYKKIFFKNSNYNINTGKHRFVA